VEEEDAKDEGGVKKKEDNKQDNEWEEEESKVNARERGDGQVRRNRIHHQGWGNFYFLL